MNLKEQKRSLVLNEVLAGRLTEQEAADAAEEREQITAQQEAILTAMESDFPLDAKAAQAMRQNIADHVLAVRDIEAAAVAALKEAMA